MKRAAITLLLCCAVLVGWLAPGLSTDVPATDDGGPANRALNAISGTGELAAQQVAAWNGGATVLTRQPDGHFYADAYVDGQPLRLLVDTGASIVALTGRDAEAMGLYWTEDSLRPIGRGASGIVYGLPVRLDRMEVGGLEARDVEAAIIPEGLDVSLLGQSFLSRIDNVDIRGDEMTLGD